MAYLRYVKCGKKNCKCNSGKKEDLHGPYYYESKRVKRKVISSYRGTKNE